MNPEKYLGSVIPLAAEEMNMQHAAVIFSEVLEKEISYQKLPKIITRLVMGKLLYKMFKWINENDAVILEDLDWQKKEFPDMLTLKQWIAINFKKM